MRGSARGTSPGSSTAPLKLWLDTDAGVDDALALGAVFAAAAERPGSVQVAGISVVRGNVAAPDALLNAARVILAYQPHHLTSSSSSSSSSSGDHRRNQPLPGDGASGLARKNVAPSGSAGGTSGDGAAGGGVSSSGGGGDGLGDVPDLAPSRRRAEAALAAVPALPAPRPLLLGPGGGPAPAPAGAGAGGAGGLGGAGERAGLNAAAAALVAAAQQAPGQLVVVALGPLTNLAAALRLDPHLPRRLRGVVVLGGGEGSGGGGNVTPWAEFNFYQDPEAAAEVMSAFARCSSSPHDSASAPASPSTTLPACAPDPACAPSAADTGSLQLQQLQPLLLQPPRLALVSWQACQRHLMAWADVDRMLTTTAVIGMEEEGEEAAEEEEEAAAQAAEGEAAGRVTAGRFLTGVLRPFLAAWRAQSPAGLLLGDPLAAAVALGMAAPRLGGGGSGCSGGGSEGASGCDGGSKEAPRGLERELGRGRDREAAAAAAAAHEGQAAAGRAVSGAGDLGRDGGGGGGGGGGNPDDGAFCAAAAASAAASSGPTDSSLVLEWRPARCSIVLEGERRGMSLLRAVPWPPAAAAAAAGAGGAAAPGATPRAAASCGGQNGEEAAARQPDATAAGWEVGEVGEEQAGVGALVAVVRQLDVAALTQMVMGAAAARPRVGTS
ncbi:hypothetical protein HYH02_009182 [Chlamydomonas schloesseri]|uniref:Inosine/uridine-preferring nucleoside hydrolase domain-containing protein n=1 Tax=Chlamydomonas schloesseri TaxID=2026947 RepID=A0A835WAX7_9CHLO|nr:hypothetical protein HYH02_009182 [Chlamydomonas schloesseri]|eukprot:KAG2443982.1 hypothetical protein HYH02_009182 [Chlamydomonas schloesseri]